jgi:hypothetical protein
MIQIEHIRGRSSDGDMAMMRWIEAAAKEGYAHGNSLADWAAPYGR